MAGTSAADSSAFSELAPSVRRAMRKVAASALDEPAPVVRRAPLTTAELDERMRVSQIGVADWERDLASIPVDLYEKRLHQIRVAFESRDDLDA